MFESAELGHRINRKTYAREEPLLRADLLDAQYDVRQAARFPVIILVNGIDGAGKGETVNLLNAWMDPRFIETRAFADPSAEERERPHMWRFWRALPPRGKVGIFFGNWYTEPIVDRVNRKLKSAELAERIDEIKLFERMLHDEGALILKFWFHLSREGQEQRLKTLEKDPKTRWRVTDADWWRLKRYDRYREVCERVLGETGAPWAPWIVVDGSNANYRELTVGRHLLKAMRKRLAVTEAGAAASPVKPISHPLTPARAIHKRTVLSVLDLTQTLSRKKYEEQLEKWQGRFNQLTREAKFRQRSLIVVFEGFDAAGKGSAIRRVTSALDARQYRVVPVGAPTEEERAQPYLWRFWRQVPRHGRIAIFDRSWYGRVLVERVEGFCAKADWLRAYTEINAFEAQLTHHGAILVKFWLAISADEQLRRFKERETTRFKRFKITEEDWRNRDQLPAYEAAVCDMVDRTSSAIAPWTLIEANDKYFARIKVLRTLCDHLETALAEPTAERAESRGKGTE
jgi:polyphosphate:AMP phosphotransferase